MVSWPASNFYVIAETANGSKFCMVARSEKEAERIADEAEYRKTNNQTPINKAYFTTRLPENVDSITFIPKGEQDKFLPRK